MLTLLPLTLVLGLDTDSLKPGNHTRTVKVGETMRTYHVHVPQKYDAKNNWNITYKALEGKFTLVDYVAWADNEPTVSLGKASAGGGKAEGRGGAGFDFTYTNKGKDPDPKTETIDFDSVRAQAKELRPKVILCGYSAYPRTIDFAKFREIADNVGAVLWVDASHFIGLVAGEAYPSPVPYADVVTFTTHKSLPLENEQNATW